MTTLEAQLQENDAPRTQLAGLRLNYMHEMQAYQASIADRAATAEQIEQSIERYPVIGPAVWCSRKCFKHSFSASNGPDNQQIVLGRCLLSPTTRQGQLLSSRSRFVGIQVDSHSLSLLANQHAIR